MGLEKLDHVNIVTTNLAGMVTWYETVLGLKSGPRPDFPFPGAWLYAGETAVVHLVEGQAGVGSEERLKLEHFAFSASGRHQFEEKLSELGQSFRSSEVPGAGLVQFHISDPDGNHIHVDFRLDD